MVGRHTDVRGSLFRHLQDRMQHADDGGEGLVLTLIGPALAVELAEQLVCAVDEMNDHSRSNFARCSALHLLSLPSSPDSDTTSPL